jgi:signal transduction histidine kinase/ActR/RegA family two-component response regulator
MRWSTLIRVELPAQVKGLLTVAVPLAALALQTFSMRVFQQEHRKADDEAGHSIQIQKEVWSALSTLQAAETALRGFLLHGDDSLLGPYRTAREGMLAALDHLEQLLNKNPGRAWRLARLRPMMEQHLRVLSELRQYAALPGVAVANPPLELLAESDRSMSNIRNVLADIRRDEEGRIEAASAQSMKAKDKADTMVVGTVGLGLVGGIVAVWLVMSSVVASEQRRARAAVEDSQRRLEEMLASAKLQASSLAQSEEALRNQKRVLESVLEGLSDGVAVISPTGQPQLWNSAATQVFPDLAYVPVKDWVDRYGLCLRDAVTPCPHEALGATCAMRGEEVNQQILFVTASRQAGGAWIRMSARPLRGERGEPRGAAVVLTDITEHQRHQEMLNRAKEEAEQANQTKSEFLSRMSHELRTPLNAILGFAQLLEMARLKAQHRQNVEHILKAGRHLLTLINEVLDISRIESGKVPLAPEPAAVGETLQEALAMVQPLAAERRIRIDSEPVTASNIHVFADRQALKQIVLNLLSNAIKYNRQGGMVSLACKPVEGDRVRLLVADTGDGIPAEKLGRLFHPFDRLGAEQTGIEGTGIGLALSRRLAEAMGGSIGVESQTGVGSTFWIDLPGAEGPAEEFDQSGAVQLAAAAAAVSQGPMVLYIEDNPSNLQLVEQILSSRREIRLLTALHGTAGIRLAQKYQPGLILLDVHLPDMDGREVLRQLKEDAQTSAIPVIVVSADATKRQEARMREAGARDYLTKPLDVPKFLSSIEEALEYVGAH